MNSGKPLQVCTKLYISWAENSPSWQLATNADYQTIRHLFGVSETAVCFIIKRKAATKVHKCSYWGLTSEGDSSFHAQVGASSVCCCGGSGAHSHYVTQLTTSTPRVASIIMQGMVVPINWHLHWMAQKSAWCKSFWQLHSPLKGNKQKNCYLSKKKKIAQEEVPLVVHADTLRTSWGMKPYIDICYDQQRFNYSLSGTRVVVEDAYGQVNWREKKKWYWDIRSTWANCILLHNLCGIHSKRFNASCGSMV